MMGIFARPVLGRLLFYGFALLTGVLSLHAVTLFVIRASDWPWTPPLAVYRAAGEILLESVKGVIR